MKEPTPTAEQITRASKSNLALAFIALSKQRRHDISVFYAFCRIVDDIADDPGVSLADRRSGLDQWRRAIVVGGAGDPPLGAAVRDLIARYRLPAEHFLEIIAGVEMDLDGASYATWEELRVYCHRVASVVGLVSIEIFGCRDPRCREYALNLGLALQLTNILRDVGEDFANGGRIYLPREDMARFGYTPEDLAAACHDDRFRALMKFEADRAFGFYAAARASLPKAERRTLVSAEIMQRIYRSILERMQADDYRVFQKRYRLTRIQKIAAVLQVMISSRLGFSS
ncbi:MAG TPA: phytoene/squalene synthase family protein [Chthoniobacteraceae bacterium]